MVTQLEDHWVVERAQILKRSLGLNSDSAANQLYNFG